MAIAPVILSLCGCSYALDSAKIKIYADESTKLNVKLLGASNLINNEVAASEVKTKFDKCGASTKIYTSRINDRSNIESKFETESFDEFDAIARCLGDNEHNIAGKFEKKDGLFSTQYYFVISGKETPFALDVFSVDQNTGNRFVEITMPGELSGVENLSDRAFSSFKIDRFGSDGVKISEYYDHAQAFAECGVAPFDLRNNDEAHRAIDALSLEKRKCLGSKVIDSKEYNWKFKITSYQNKFDLSIWVTLIGAVLGSGILANIIGVALKKQKRSPRAGAA